MTEQDSRDNLTPGDGEGDGDGMFSMRNAGPPSAAADDMAIMAIGLDTLLPALYTLTDMRHRHRDAIDAGGPQSPRAKRMSTEVSRCERAYVNAMRALVARCFAASLNAAARGDHE